MNGSPADQPGLVTEKVRIDFDNPEGASLSILLFDTRGKLIRSTRKVTGSSFVFEKEGLSKGMYLVLVRGIKNLPKLIILN